MAFLYLGVADEDDGVLDVLEAVVVAVEHLAIDDQGLPSRQGCLDITAL